MQLFLKTSAITIMICKIFKLVTLIKKSFRRLSEYANYLMRFRISIALPLMTERDLYRKIGLRKKVELRLSNFRYIFYQRVLNTISKLIEHLDFYW